LARKKHFQHGSLFKRGERNKVWVARYREPVRVLESFTAILEGNET